MNPIHPQLTELAPDEMRDVNGGGDLIDAILRELAERAAEAIRDALRPKLPTL